MLPDKLKYFQAPEVDELPREAEIDDVKKWEGDLYQFDGLIWRPLSRRQDSVVQANPSVRIDRLMVSNPPLPQVSLGDVDSTVRLTKMNDGNIKAIIWNEEGIALLLNQTDAEIVFQPEIHYCSKIFFKKKGGYHDEEEWRGEYDSVSFSKKALISFLNDNAEYFDDEVKKAIKSLRLVEKRRDQSDEILLEDDSSRTVSVEEESTTTNLPRHFSAMMPLFGEYKAELKFEASVVKKDSHTSRSSKRSIIVLACINAKEAKIEAMKKVLEEFPEDIPRYYGSLDIKMR